MVLAVTDERSCYEGVKQAKKALCANGAQEHCDSTWAEIMETNAFFIMTAAINAPVSPDIAFWAENDSPSN